MSIVILLIQLYSLVNSCGATPLTATMESNDLMSCAGVAHLTSENVLQTDMNSQRSTLDILWSCLATTFAVTWLSVHPNIPASDEKQWRVTGRRFKLMFWALVAPEFIVLWAWRQRQGARRIAEEMRKFAKRENQKYGHDWTITHGHFLQMGGFTIQFNEEQPRVLYFEHFKSMVGNNLDIPSISAEEINDKGKSDPLGKGIATLQILWFIIQVITRQVYHLDITQLELTTAALACLNATMYILWWNKPSDVRCPIIIRSRLLRPLEQPVQAPGRAFFLDSPPHYEISIPDCEVPMQDYEVSIQESNGGQGMAMSTPCTANLTVFQPRKPKGLLALLARFSSVIKVLLARFSLVIERTLVSSRAIQTLGILALPIAPFTYLVLGSLGESNGLPENRPSVFYVWTRDYYMDAINLSGAPYRSIQKFREGPATTWKELLVASLVGCFFGGIHILGWKLEFPSLAEKTIWNISACTITVAPCLYMLFPLLYPRNQWREKWEFLLFLMYLRTLVSHCVVIARILLFIDSLLALRALPLSAFATVNWLAVIPHI